MPEAVTSPISSDPRASAAQGQELFPAVVLVWSKYEPHRVGEVALFPWLGRPLALGIGAGEGEDRAELVRQRPGEHEVTGPLTSEGISRKQLVAERVAIGLNVTSAGRCPTYINGEPFRPRVLIPGDTIYFKRRALFLVTLRPRVMRALAWPDGAHRPFGEPDVAGMIGESFAKWTLCDRIAYVARQSEPAIVRGESGAGKELVARMIHKLSLRAKGPFIACSGAALTITILVAELFGGMKGFPNAGSPDRPGLVGRADGGTLFMDEIASLPREGQEDLLRLLDQALEYQRVGEGITRHANLRFVGAMNRKWSALAPDVLERFIHRVEIPTLGERREDIPLIARHLVLEAAEADKDSERFVRKVNGRREVTFDPALIELLVRADWTGGNVRRLKRALARAREGEGETLRLTEATRREIEGAREEAEAGGAGDAEEASEDSRRGEGPRTVRAAPKARKAKPSEGEVSAALESHAGSVSRAAEALGMHRNALIRLMEKYGMR